MKNKIMGGMSSWSQLFFLVLFAFAGLILSALIMLVTGGDSLEMMQSVNFLKIMQLVQAVCLFLLPSCICAYLFHERPWEYLKTDKPLNFRFLFFSLLLIVAIQPFISFTGYYNSLMTFPESIAGVERWMKHAEETTNTLMIKFLTADSFPVLLLNIFIVAIVAGITEEFFFRGSLQQIFKKICRNRHLAVWITAFIFGFIHIQFYGFIPRFILGAILGYIFLWSGDLWIAIIVHAVNNLMSILVFHFYHGTPVYEQIEQIGTGDTLWLAGVSVFLSGVILYLLSQEYQKNNPEDFAI